MNCMNNEAKVDPEKEFPLVEKMLYSLAWKFSTTYPMPFDEAKSEAYYAFVKSCYDFNASKKMKFSSWVYYWVWCHLKNIVTKRTVEPIVFVDMDENQEGEAPVDRALPKDAFADLTEDAKEIISLLLETPSELLGGKELGPVRLLDRVRSHLKQKGKTEDELEWAEREITLRLRQGFAC